jgi:putative membrane protein
LQRVGYVFVATIQAWALAALLGFATAPYYAYALLPSRPGGISALTDQQFGAGIMWVPGSITYSIVFIACIYLWFRDEDRAAQSFTRRPIEVAAK